VACGHLDVVDGAAGQCGVWFGETGGRDIADVVKERGSGLGCVPAGERGNFGDIDTGRETEVDPDVDVGLGDGGVCDTAICAEKNAGACGCFVLVTSNGSAVD
jgi:hypothetical protein